MENYLLDVSEKVTKSISVSHIYSKKNSLTGMDKYAHLFLKYDILDIKDEYTLPEKAHIFILEFEKIDKNILKFIQKIALKYNLSHIYLFTAMDTNTSILKFSLNYDIKNVYSLNCNEDFIKEFLNKSVKKAALHLHEVNISYLGEQMDTLYPVLVFERKKLSFINTGTKRFFGTDNFHFIENIIRKNRDLYALITDYKSSFSRMLVENGKKEYKELYCSIKYLEKEQKTILSIFQNENLIDTDIENLIQNRFIFIEKLKDKIVQMNITKKDFFIVMVSIDNGKNLQNVYSKAEYYNFLKDFLLNLNNFKDNSEKIVEWNKNLFILLYEGLNFDDMKSFASILHNNIIESQKESKFAPIITTSFVSVANKDLNSIIEFIDKVDSNALSMEEIVKENYFEYKFLNDRISEQEQINHLLHNCINNKIPVKLLNIYKDLCVNTESKVLKYADGFFYLSCEKLQRYIIKIDNETVIQSPSFPHDIRAMVKFIDLSKSYIVVEKFEFLKHSANNRQHTRVQPTVRIPITIRKGHFIKNGEILDLSINAIAIKVKQNIDKTLEGSIVQTMFKLPNRKKEDGYSLVDVEAEILMVIKMEDFTKVVLKLKEEDGTNSDILQYVFTRQKELVVELKKAIKVL
jgi:GGDEF domain-containing protein